MRTRLAGLSGGLVREAEGERSWFDRELDADAYFAIAPERRPPLDAEQILALVDRWPGKAGELTSHLIANARPADLLEALARAADDRAREVICNVCGFGRVQEALPALTALLDDPSTSVRSAAADAIGKIGEARAEPDAEVEAAGTALLRRVAAEPEPLTRRSMAVGLEGLRYRPALGVLREAAEQDAFLGDVADRIEAADGAAPPRA